MNRFSLIFLLVCLLFQSFSCETLKNLVKKRFHFDHRHFFNEHEMLLFPDIAFPVLTETNQWKVMIHGWRYQRSDMKHLFELTVNHWIEHLADEILNDDEIRNLNQTIKTERLRPFFVQENYNEIITIRLGNLTRQIRTDENGEFYESIDLTTKEIDALKREQNSDRILRYEAIGHDRKVFNGTIFLIESTGEMSIISDIDDTIKISDVLDKLRLLTNTFVLPFEPVRGMSDLYRHWSIVYPNSTFHYLSAMPDQMFTLTKEFLLENEFPFGSFHMRHFDWSLHSLFQFVHSQSTFDHKLRYLRFFFTHLRRRFILIGDSGEKDPEIYGIITREYPEVVQKIFIRAIQNESMTDQRFLDAFRDIPQEKWMIFTDPQQISLQLLTNRKCCL